MSRDRQGVSHRTALAIVTLAGLLAAAGWQLRSTSYAYPSNTGATSMLAHNVFFSLNEPTEANRKKLVDACHQYLSNHPGTLFYCAGTVSDLDRPVNDRDFDVGLHLIFKDRAAHDVYQEAPLHKQFIAENKDSWKKVRVFDSDVSEHR